MEMAAEPLGRQHVRGKDADDNGSRECTQDQRIAQGQVVEAASADPSVQAVYLGVGGG